MLRPEGIAIADGDPFFTVIQRCLPPAESDVSL
jgi:hypothetical protein